MEDSTATGTPAESENSGIFTGRQALWPCSHEPGPPRRPPLGSSTPQPQNGVFKQPVQLLAADELVPVAHIHVKHAVASVGPYHGQVAGGNGVFQSQGIICGIKRKQHLHVFVEARAWFPDIPLVCRSR